MVNKNFTITRGNSLQFRINFVNAEVLPDELYLTVKNTYNDPSSIITLSLGHGIEKVVDANSYEVYINATSTEFLEYLNYIYQITAVYSDEPDTIVEGKLIITPEL